MFSISTIALASVYSFTALMFSYGAFVISPSWPPPLAASSHLSPTFLCVFKQHSNKRAATRGASLAVCLIAGCCDERETGQLNASPPDPTPETTCSHQPAHQPQGETIRESSAAGKQEEAQGKEMGRAGKERGVIKKLGAYCTNMHLTRGSIEKRRRITTTWDNHMQPDVFARLEMKPARFKILIAPALQLRESSWILPCGSPPPWQRKVINSISSNLNTHSSHRRHHTLPAPQTGLLHGNLKQTWRYEPSKLPTHENEI